MQRKKPETGHLKSVMKHSNAVISSGLGSSAGVGPRRTWMGDAAGCGGGDSVGGPLPSQGGPQPTPSPGL